MAPTTDAPPAPADDAPRVPVLDWREDEWRENVVRLDAGYHHYGLRLSAGPASWGGEGWEWGHGTGATSGFPTRVAAQVAAEDWLREQLAPLAPLFATGGTDAE